VRETFNVAIFAALQWECRPILRHFGAPRRQTLAGFTIWQAAREATRVTLVKTGVGPLRADAAARAMAATAAFDVFLSSGCAGALAEHLDPGDLIVAESVGPTDAPARHLADERQRRHLLDAAERAGLRPTVGRIVTSPKVLATADEKRAVAASGAVAVEMEGAAIAAVAAELDIAFGAVRSVLDPATCTLERSGVLVDPASGGVRPMAVLGQLIRHPASLSSLLEMKRMMDAAEATLARFFREYLQPLVSRV
jgi:adenosylhomocysteine nucleosidase